MTESIGTLLHGRKYEEPPEAAVIRKFVQDTFAAEAKVSVQERQIIISVRSASLAGALRTHLHELTKLCQTDKRLVIRIS